MKRRFILKRGGYLGEDEIYNAAYAYVYPKLKNSKLSSDISIDVAQKCEYGMMCDFELKRAVEAELLRREFKVVKIF